MPRQRTVVLGMSGGVDSSVAVYLLQQAGYRVHGVHLRLIPARLQQNSGAEEDARAVAKQYGIPFTVLDYSAEFEKVVIEQFANSYLRGKTPNPCVLCNRHIKFGLLFEEAGRMGADFVSTGHYVRLKTHETGHKLLYKAVDLQKDQSYFLARIRPAVLERAIFPLGEYRKTEVRALAAQLALPVAQKRDSQEVCFIADNDYKGFLRRYLPAASLQPGEILHEDGRRLGAHGGIQDYTIGQRRGLGIALGEPAYVTGLDPVRHLVVLGEERSLYHRQLHAVDNNCFLPLPLETSIPVEAKIRSRAPAFPAELFLHADGTSTVRFAAPQRAITPGQCVGYYQGDALLGGGIIARVEDPL